ncbi:unnamed protein product [Arctogadus glacialis]
MDLSVPLKGREGHFAAGSTANCVCLTRTLAARRNNTPSFHCSEVYCFSVFCLTVSLRSYVPQPQTLHDILPPARTITFCKQCPANGPLLSPSSIHPLSCVYKHQCPALPVPPQHST